MTSDVKIAAEKDGRAAWACGVSYGGNPYTLDANWDGHMGWAKGWRDAMNEETERRIRAFKATYEANARRRGQYER